MVSKYNKYNEETQVESVKRQSIRFDRLVQLIKEKNGLLFKPLEEVETPLDKNQTKKMDAIVKKLKKIKKRKMK